MAILAKDFRGLDFRIQRPYILQAVTFKCPSCVSNQTSLLMAPYTTIFYNELWNAVEKRKWEICRVRDSEDGGRRTVDMGTFLGGPHLGHPNGGPFRPS